MSFSGDSSCSRYSSCANMRKLTAHISSCTHSNRMFDLGTYTSMNYDQSSW